MALAEARLFGDFGPPDRAAALAAVRQAASLGYEDGRRAWVYFTAAGIGCAPDPVAARQMLAELAREDRFAALQHAFLDHMTCRARLKSVRPTIVSRDPYIALYPKLFSAAECRYLMILGTPWMEKASILNLSGEAAFDPARDASAAHIPPVAEDLVVQEVNRCIADATGTEPGWGEPLNILRYAPGQQYKPHHDGTSPDNVSVRVLTALIWLNDGFVGGETDFPKIKVRVRGEVGDMLVFRNVLMNDNPDPRMIHAGLPVSDGVKWMASRWIRGTDFLS
ncbi:prolyl hydroxylase family protein [Sphingomonas mesophila]|uniref:prolyl hydroxylase family protein n=1 Tax=Sphingomonas mesophila TaxID=2303576 RepID=UPI0013C2FB57|nr:2OG-Fe(II) oxygenase [Sphingomonas mesophila]